MSWIKKAFGVAAVLGGTGMFACSGTNQLVGSDGQPVGNRNSAGTSASQAGSGSSSVGNGNGGSATTNGGGSTTAARDPELNYEAWQINAIAPHNGHPVCLPMALPVDPETGNAACNLLKVSADTDCNCAAAGLSPVSDDLTHVTRRHVAVAGLCDTAGSARCADLCVCRVDPAVGSSLQECQSEAEPDANTTGWCYVADTGDAAQQALVEGCPTSEKQRLRFFGGAVTEHDADDITPHDLLFMGCPWSRPVAALGERCISDDEYSPNFRGFDVREVNVENYAFMCESGICLQNHFQGRASCPYGQADLSQDCLTAGRDNPVNGAVEPQLVSRRADVASICSCRCAGPGPGPFCTCPESMQCQPLVEALGLGADDLAGSYCIPAGTQYDQDADSTTCSDGNCGPAHNQF